MQADLLIILLIVLGIWLFNEWQHQYLSYLCGVSNPFLIVSSHSMLPTLHRGDIIMVVSPHSLLATTHFSPLSLSFLSLTARHMLSFASSGLLPLVEENEWRRNSNETECRQCPHRFRLGELVVFYPSYAHIPTVHRTIQVVSK
jgi:hypothetical protein